MVIMAVMGFILPVKIDSNVIVGCSQRESGFWVGRGVRLVFCFSALPMPQVQIEREVLFKIALWFDVKEQVPFPLLWRSRHNVHLN